jgi:hypothetical protein
MKPTAKLHNTKWQMAEKGTLDSGREQELRLQTKRQLLRGKDDRGEGDGRDEN